MNQQKSTFIFILTLGILSMLPPFGVDMYLPSFLEIAKDLGVSPEQVQHTLTSFAYGMAFGQLFWGPFGDSFGRKPIILLGVIVGALTALVLTEIKLVFMLAPLVAPIIGGYIVKFFHWHAIFYVISLVGLLAAALVFFIIPETHKKENRIPLRLNIIARNFLLLWKQKEVLGYMFAASFSFGGLFAFVTAGSIVYIGIYGVPVDQFGYFFMMNIVTMIFASFLNSRFVTKVGAETMLRIALAIQFLSGMWLILTALLDLGFWPMAIGVAFFVGPNPVISSNAMASALEKCPQMAGTTNSLIGSVRFAVGAIMGSLVASMKMDTAAPMLFTMGACVVISVLAYYFLTSRNLKSRG
ncbi:TPA: Bcr/CflA family multidrug efflux MFS transporter [Haemophilus influenzae]